MQLEQRIRAFAELGRKLGQLVDSVDHGKGNSGFSGLLNRVEAANPWFTEANCIRAFSEWSSLLKEDQLNIWLKPYRDSITESGSRKVGVINAGNIPLVGFHDFLSVLICGHSYLGKNASNDNLILPYLAGLLTEAEPGFSDQIIFSERLSGFDAVIATGSNNSARYFDYYFGKYPHVIRRNRNGVAILDGTEHADDLKKLGEDIFRYFGLGCRNVSKLYVPENYNFNLFFESMYGFNEVMGHNKYLNNFEYNNALYLLKSLPFLQNGFLIIIESESIASPIAVLHFEKYSSNDLLQKKLIDSKENIQCIAVNKPGDFSELNRHIPVVEFGQTQSPGLADYADGVDTIQFLCEIKAAKSVS